MQRRQEFGFPGDLGATASLPNEDDVNISLAEYQYLRRCQLQMGLMEKAYAQTEAKETGKEMKSRRTVDALMNDVLSQEEMQKRRRTYGSPPMMADLQDGVDTSEELKRTGKLVGTPFSAASHSLHGQTTHSVRDMEVVEVAGPPLSQSTPHDEDRSEQERAFDFNAYTQELMNEDEDILEEYERVVGPAALKRHVSKLDDRRRSSIKGDGLQDYDARNGGDNWKRQNHGDAVDSEFPNHDIRQLSLEEQLEKVLSENEELKARLELRQPVVRNLPSDLVHGGRIDEESMPRSLRPVPVMHANVDGDHGRWQDDAEVSRQDMRQLSIEERYRQLLLEDKKLRKIPGNGVFLV